MNNKISLVYVSSIVSSLGFVDLDDYGATKSAAESLIRSISVRFPRSRFNSVAPGFTETEMAKETLTPAERENLLRESPFKRMAQPEEVAHAILFLASSEAAYSSGTIIDVNGASYLRS